MCLSKPLTVAMVNGGHLGSMCMIACDDCKIVLEAVLGCSSPLLEVSITDGVSGAQYGTWILVKPTDGVDMGRRMLTGLRRFHKLFGGLYSTPRTPLEWGKILIYLAKEVTIDVERA